MATLLKIGIALLIGFGAFFVLAPTSGSGIGCSSLLLREVPCDGVMAAVVGGMVAIAVMLGLWFVFRRRADSP